jgi:MATE family multidrug resistance protein
LFEQVRRLLHLGLPLVGAQLLSMSMGVADVIMTSRYDPLHLAGVALGSSFFWPLSVLCSGILAAASPIVAQCFGAGRLGDAGEPIRQGVWVSFACALLLAGVLAAAPALMLRFGLDAAAVDIARRYLHFTAAGAPCLLLYTLLLFTCNGLGHTRVALGIIATTFAFKIPLSYALIHGAAGLPELGGPGGALASAIAWSVHLALIVGVARRPWFRATTFWQRFSWPDPRGMWRFLALGVPIGIVRFMETAFFSAVSVMVGTLGPLPLAAHQVALNINGVLFMPPMAFGNAAGVVIGQHVGARDFARVRLAARATIIVTLAYSAVAALVVALSRHGLVAIYSDDAAVASLAATLLWFVVAYQFFDNTQATALGALGGLKDTRTPMLITTAGYWLVGAPAAVLLGSRHFGSDLGIHGYWGALFIALVAVAVVANLRLLRMSVDRARIERFAQR